MDANNWRPTVPGGEPVMDTGDWRTQLQPDLRQRIVNRIMETLKRHLPFSGQEGLQELKKIAIRFEEKIYTAATSQSDYLRKISLKMLTMETKSQNTIPNSLTSNTAVNGNIPLDPGGETVQQQSQQAAGIHQQQTPMMLQPPLSTQQQLMGQQSNATNMSQNQLIGQQNIVGDLQQQLIAQQNNLSNLHL